jgi:hypothetical protein
MTWLDKITESLAFEPYRLGSNYQPLATSWSFKRDSSPIYSRISFGYTVFHRGGSPKLLIAGGYCPERSSRRNEVFHVDPLTGAPELVSKSAEWTPRINFSILSSVDGSDTFILGGDDGSVKADVWWSGDQGCKFKLCCEEAPWAGRIDFAATLVEDTLIVVGGRIPGRAGPGQLLSDVWISSAKGRSWMQVAPFSSWRPRAFSSLASLNSCLILVGGLTETSTSDEVWISKDIGRTWDRVTERRVPWKPRKSPGIAVDNYSGEVLIFGGFSSDGTGLTDSWASIDCGKTWMPRKHVPDLAASSPVVAWTDSGRICLISSAGGVETTSDLKFIKRDCRTLLKLGSRVSHHIPMDLWVGLVLPYAVDTRVLQKRVRVPWSQL